jgi:hypothetical protein
MWQEAATVPCWYALGARIPKRVAGHANRVTEKHRGYHGAYRVTNKTGSEWHARHKGTFGYARQNTNLGKNIGTNTHTTNLGTFGTVQEAALAYDKEHREILKCTGCRDPRLQAHKLNYPDDPQPANNTDAARAVFINTLSERPDPRLTEGNPLPDRAPDPPPTANNVPTYSTVLDITDDDGWKLTDDLGNVQSKSRAEAMREIHERMDTIRWTSFENDGYVQAATTAVTAEMRKTKSGERMRRVEIRNPGSTPTAPAEGPILTGPPLVEALLSIKTTNKMSDERIANAISEMFAADNETFRNCKYPSLRMLNDIIKQTRPPGIQEFAIAKWVARQTALPEAPSANERAAEQTPAAALSTPRATRTTQRPTRFTNDDSHQQNTARTVTRPTQ